MGNITSGDEKSSRRRRNKFKRKNASEIDWINDQYGYHQIRKEDYRFWNRRNTSFHFKNGTNEFSKSKSHSLDAIFEELYLSGTENSSIHGTAPLFNYSTNRPFIPRIKLTRSVSNLREEKRYTLFKMSTKQEILHFQDSENSPNKGIHLKEEDEERDTEKSVSYINNNNNDYDETLKKTDENYFAKNFDECMKRLQMIEKEHELIEKVDSNIELYFLKDQTDIEHSKGEETHNFKAVGENEDNTISIDIGNGKEEEAKQNSESSKISNGCSQDEEITSENQQSITEWYSTVKQHFEKSKTEEVNPKEMSCRITGATLKNSSETQKPEDAKEETRHYFSRLVKSNKSLIDEELPDPDKVKNIRAMFQENLNSTLKRTLDKKFGGSLQNINASSGEHHKCNKDDIIEVIRQAQDKKDVMELKDCEREFPIEATKRKLFEKYDKDLKIGKDFRPRKLLQPKWTDSGSVSSGVSSDLSSFDTDIEGFSKEGPDPEPEPDDVLISDDDLLEEVKDKHYVQNEILKKIRSFGTSVTYYGGEMITCSVGPLLSPTAQAIMEEIGEYGNDSSPSRSFEEFYRKYVETNEPNRKKKLGRARSFGQNDMFQRPNVLSNTEIEMYKNDLELEIGIKKPAGIPQNGLKLKLNNKFNTIDSRSVPDEKVEKKLPETPIITIDVVSENENENKNPNCDLAEETKSVETYKNEALIQEMKSNAEKDDLPNPKPNENEEIPVSTFIEENEISEDKNERKERFLERSISAPEGIKIVQENSEFPSKEILFSYEKSLLNGKKNSDMEFEEFEVCETVTEKLEKLDESAGNQNSVVTFESESQEGEVNKSKEETQVRREFNVDFAEENKKNNNKDSVSFESEKVQENAEQVMRSKPILNRSQSDIKYTRHSQSRWPIETTVMVDIQKNNEQTPKVILNGKTSRTKLRLF